MTPEGLIDLFRFTAFVQAVIGALLLAGLVIWKDDFRKWRK